MAVVEPLPQQPGGRRRVRLRSPATLDEIAELELATPDDVRTAVERARKAQPAWGALAPSARARVLRRAVRVLVQRAEEIAAQLAAETGKPETEALATELLPACDALEFWAKRAPRILGERRIPLHLLRTKRLELVHHPLGVVGVITPWNFPLLLALVPTVQALAAGNAVVLKPSEVAPGAARLLESVLREAGLPDDVLICVVGDGEAGAALVESDVDLVCFTGSSGTGRRVAEACARRLVPCILELGGKDAFVVCADADLERAARGAVYGAFANAGQVCVSAERVLVVDEVAERFTDLVVERTAELRQGVGGDTDVGPIIWPPQLDVIERHVADAVSRGARVLTGGRRNPEWPGLFYEPTVLADVRPDMLVMQEESFGPLLPILRVADEDEAVQIANATPHGLSASVWTRDKRRGAALAKRLVTGGALVNDVLLGYAIPEAPFGGVRESGLGRVSGEMGLRSFCRVQSVVIDRLGTRSEPFWHPYGTRKAKRLRRAMRLLWGSPLGRWLS